LQLGKAVSSARISRHQDRKFGSATASLRPLLNPLADHDQAAPKLIRLHLLNVQTGYLRGLPWLVIMAAKALNLLRQLGHQNELQPQFLRHCHHAVMAKTGIPAQQANPDMTGRVLYRLAQKLRRAVDAGAVPAPQPIVGDEFAFGQRRDQRPMARFESRPRVAHRHPLLMAILVQQRPGIQVQGITGLEGRR